MWSINELHNLQLNTTYDAAGSYICLAWSFSPRISEPQVVISLRLTFCVVLHSMSCMLKKEKKSLRFSVIITGAS